MSVAPTVRWVFGCYWPEADIEDSEPVLLLPPSLLPDEILSRAAKTVLSPPNRSEKSDDMCAPVVTLLLRILY